MKKLFLISMVLISVLSACKKKGCTNESATNYDEKAKKDDGSCVYPEPEPTINNFGEITTAVVIVNPVINQGSSTTVSSGTERSGVSITAGSLAAINTDATGLAIIENVATGTIPFKFSSGSVDVDIIQEKELYDVVVSYKSNGVQEIVQEIRYPIGGSVTTVKVGESISTAAATDNAIIFLEAGTYEQDLTIKGDGVLIFGAWSATDGPLSIINGTVNAQGNDTRTRGINITGNIIAKADGYSAAFCTFKNADVSGNNVTLIRNKFTGSNVSVTSTSAVLLDNENLP